MATAPAAGSVLNTLSLKFLRLADKGYLDEDTMRSVLQRSLNYASRNEGVSRAPPSSQTHSSDAALQIPPSISDIASPSSSTQRQLRPHQEQPVRGRSETRYPRGDNGHSPSRPAFKMGSHLSPSPSRSTSPITSQFPSPPSRRYRTASASPEGRPPESQGSISSKSRVRGAEERVDKAQLRLLMPSGGDREKTIDKSWTESLRLAS